MPQTTPSGSQRSMFDDKDKPGNSGGKGKEDKERNFRYVDCSLSTEQKESLRYWREHDADLQALSEWVDKVLANGHTVSIKAEEVGYLANVTGVRSSSNHVDMCLNARASTATNALFAVMYKDEEVLKGQWTIRDRKGELDLE